MAWKVLTNTGAEKRTTGGGSGAGVGSYTITQASHGFSVGNVLIYNGASYALAKADTPDNAEVVGMVASVIDTSNFTLQVTGEVTGLTGLTAGTTYFLDDVTAGALSATQPSTFGHISKPLGVAVSSSALFFSNMRGEVVQSSGSTPIITTSAYSGGAPTSPSDGDIWIATQGTTGGRFISQYDASSASWKHLSSTTLLWDSTDAGVTFPTATITTPTLLTIFDTLRVDFRVRGNGGTNTLTNLALRINGVSTASYYAQLMQSHATTAAASESIAATSAPIGLIPQGSGGDWGTGTLWVPGYQATNPSFHSISGGSYGTGTNTSWNGTYGGFYIGTGISTLTFLDSGANSFINPSRISVYGVMAS